MNSNKNDSERVFSDNDIVQVLSLDGGGLKGLYSASVIKLIEQQLGHSISDHFDIITGTSTGGLIALALSRGKSGEDIQNFYLDNGEKIFPSRGLSGFLRKFKSIIFSKYNNESLETVLKNLLKETDGSQPLLRDSPKRLIIPTYLSEVSQPRLLKTPHASRLKNDWRMPMWAVGMATTAAPTFLPSFHYQNRTYLDGGVWANNPSLIGVTEALDLGAKLENIRVLNIGTTYSKKTNTDSKILGFKFKRGGIFSWATNILPLVMEANSYSISKMYTHQLLSKGNFFVIDKQINEGQFSLDKINNSTFIEMGESDGESFFSKITDFFNHNSAVYTPSVEAIQNGK